jgi:hypothetical protein
VIYSGIVLVQHYNQAVRIFPQCNEGFRRLSVVLALLVFLFFLFKWCREDLLEIQKNVKMCHDDYAGTVNEACGKPWRKDTPQACLQEAEDTQKGCVSDFGFRADRLILWSLYALGALIIAYAAALGIRTLGWVFLGFRSHPTP